MRLPSHPRARISPEFSNNYKMRRKTGLRRVGCFPHRSRWNEKRVVGLPPPRICSHVAYPSITAASSVDSYRVPDLLVGSTGLFPSLCPRRNAPLPRLSKGDPPDDGVFNAGFHDLLDDLKDLIGSEQTDDQSDDRDISTLDERRSSIVSQTVESGEETRRNTVRSPTSSTSRPPLPPLPPPISQAMPPRTKKKSSMGNAWNRFKKLLMRKFLGGDRTQPKLSDRLVPERDDEVRWYETLFPKPPKPAKTGK